jgi:ubiquinone/menaquinone biosynthesis C-methylase UbiE
MDSATLVSLITEAVRPGDSVWADFGSGGGAFTRTLRALLGPDADIYSVERNAATLRQQRRSWPAGDGLAKTHFVHADFTHALDMPPLDGVLLANALHFVEDQVAALRQVRRYLKPTGTLAIVEYQASSASPYVPFPIPYEAFARLISAAGFHHPRRLTTVATRYGRGMYSATAQPHPAS